MNRILIKCGICFFVLSACSPRNDGSHKPADLLDAIKSETKLIKDLKDVYRAYKVYHTIENIQEIISIRLSNLNNPDTSQVETFISDTLDITPETYLRNNASALISTCEKLQGFEFSNDSLRFYIESYISSTIRNAMILLDKGYKSREYKDDDVIYAKQFKNSLSYVIREYPLVRFTKLTEDEYWKTLDKKNYIRGKEFDEYKAIVDKDLMAGFNILENLSKTSADFKESSIYQIELADQFVKKDSVIRADLSGAEGPTTMHMASHKYNAIIGKKQYSLYLFETWLKYRTVLQFDLGMSKVSDIPNEEYDRVREQAAQVVLGYISNHQKDDMAINQFLLLATHEIVTRFAGEPFGNMAEVEFYKLFLK